MGGRKGGEVSGEEGMEVDQETKKESSSSDVVRWESSLPPMVLRVLLVEADDSTRQIIAALLRKCSYRVAAVPDGLKAWETLKGSPHDIDLILTEVELPSISGYALLTLIMEHDICKNIPVIMMSSHDSISVVLKCMLKGAADFLIKPVRRNELRNLWQHVWRRRTQTSGHFSQDTPAAQHNVEATSENNVTRNHSSDYLGSIQKKRGSEKVSDAQSSCTMPYLEAESAYMQNMQAMSQIKCGSASGLSNTERHDEYVEFVEKSVIPKSESGGKSIKSGPEVSYCIEAYDSTAFRLKEDHARATAVTTDAGVCPESHRENDNFFGEIDCDIDELVEPLSEAIDLIGKFENFPADINGHSSVNNGTDKLWTHLELSLRRSYPSCSKEEGTDEMHTLNHSNPSAFSRYDNSKKVQPLFPTSASNCAEAEEGASISHNQISNQLPENSLGTSLWLGAAWSNNQENMISQSEQAEAALPGCQIGFIPVAGVKFDNLCGGHGHIFPPIFHTQSGFPPLWSPKSAGQREQSPCPRSSSLYSCSEIHNSEQGYGPFGGTTNHSGDQTVQKEDNFESVEVLRHGSPVPGLSAISSLCNGVTSKLNSSVCGSICNTDDGNGNPAPAIGRATVSESVNDNHLLVHDGLRGMDSHPSTQREAALLKFRLKRKDRCYEKKVRYQSRKRLAEQRPRVKGQFVRQVQTEPLPADADGCS